MMTLQELHTIIKTPDSEILDGCDLHLKRCWEYGQAESIFRITGLDVRGLITPNRREFFEIKDPRSMGRMNIRTLE